MSNYFKHKIKTKSPAEIAGWVVLGIVAITGLAILFGFIIMWLWNWLAPEIFGLPVIGYWQAVGLFILFKILFGGMGGGGNNKKHKSSKNNYDYECDNKKGKSDFSKWKMYDKYWEEEGDKAFNDYVEKKRNLESEEE